MHKVYHGRLLAHLKGIMKACVNYVCSTPCLPTFAKELCELAQICSGAQGVLTIVTIQNTQLTLTRLPTHILDSCRLLNEKPSLGFSDEYPRAQASHPYCGLAETGGFAAGTPFPQKKHQSPLCCAAEVMQKD